MHCTLDQNLTQKKKIQTTTNISFSRVSNSSGDKSKAIARSLPHVYNMVRSPSADDDDGDAWRYVNEIILRILSVVLLTILLQ